MCIAPAYAHSRPERWRAHSRAQRRVASTPIARQRAVLSAAKKAKQQSENHIPYTPSKDSIIAQLQEEIAYQKVSSRVLQYCWDFHQVVSFVGMHHSLPWLNNHWRRLYSLYLHRAISSLLHTLLTDTDKENFRKKRYIFHRVL